MRVKVLQTLITVALLFVVITGIWFWKRFPVSDPRSGITGTVLLGPICPVMRVPPDSACADKPYQTRLAVTTPDGARVIEEFSSDANGRFTVSVTPGEYIIRSVITENILPRCGTSNVVKVNAGTYTSTTVYCDTGIR